MRKLHYIHHARAELRAARSEVNNVPFYTNILIFSDLTPYFGTIPQCSISVCTKQGGCKFPTSNKPRLKECIVAINRDEQGIKVNFWGHAKTPRCAEITLTIYYKGKEGWCCG